MYIVCSDLEGVFVPEVWVNVSKKTGIEELKLTTRDINDYDLLMKKRLSILREHNLTLQDIQHVISSIDPLPGAKDFLTWLRTVSQLIIVSDTFVEFADPLMEKLDRPTLFCHQLTVGKDGMILNYNLRQKDSKKQIVKALQSLNYKVIGVGDSYNDVSMLNQADARVFYRPPDKVTADFPKIPVVQSYSELKHVLQGYFATL